ncbi:hypothetical protein AA481_004872 [Salmonella enterica subsp. enterica]|nr:hypothetical protein [Salmonella enterica subsp. enterica serovar Abaetetuba]
MLGWVRYLKIIQWVNRRYDMRLIVLCPDEVYQTGIVCGRNTMAVNGECGHAELSLLLLRAVLRCPPGDTLKFDKACSWLSFREMASQALLFYPASEPGHPATQKAYRQRDSIVKRLGFTSLMRLKIFMAGFIR